MFWDRTIPAGLTWRQFIGKELADARCLVVAWSKISVKSRWVIEEAEDGSLKRADLRYAKLQGADLRDAKLQGACLEDANLEGADLRYAQLAVAVLHIDWAVCLSETHPPS